jgi:hypothetical protein
LYSDWPCLRGETGRREREGGRVKRKEGKDWVRDRRKGRRREEKKKHT